MLYVVILAFMAIINMTAVSGWHVSTFHDDTEHAQLDGWNHSHDKSDVDADSLVHLAAHCLGHAIGLPGQVTALASVVAAYRSWPIPLSAALASNPSGYLLRPPKG